MAQESHDLNTQMRPNDNLARDQNDVDIYYKKKKNIDKFTCYTYAIHL